LISEGVGGEPENSKCKSSFFAKQRQSGGIKITAEEQKKRSIGKAELYARAR